MTRVEPAAQLDVIGFGALNVDQFFRVERILVDSETQVTGGERAPGGSAANTIYGLAKLGLKAGFIGAVGDDDGGELLIESFRSVGVDTSHIGVKKGAKTGSTLCFIAEGGERAIYVEPGANSHLMEEDIDSSYASRAEMVHLSSFTDEKQLELQKRLVAELPQPIKISFAPGAIYARKGLDVLRPIIERAHVVFLNREELQLLTGADLEEGAKGLRACGSRIVVVTLGEEGSYLATEESAFLIEAVKAAHAVDTTGAGDAYATGFLYGLLTGKDLKGSAHLGHLVASFCVSKIGARAGLPTSEELQQALN